MLTTIRPPFLAVMLTAALVPVAAAQTSTSPPPQKPPDFRVQIWGSVMTDFKLRVQGYADLRRSLEIGLQPLRVTADPAELRSREVALAERIRHARPAAVEGEFFTQPIDGEFRQLLRIQSDVETCDSLMDDNPGEFEHPIYGTYPKTKPLSTVPPNILAVLPDLPDGIQYRFLGRTLVLHDTRANVILDRMAYAVDCTGGRASTRAGVRHSTR